MRPYKVLVSLVVLVSLGGCAQAGAPSSSVDGKASVVASFYPVWEAAARIAGNAADVENLTPAGVEPHDLELTSRSIDEIIDAEVVLYLGHGFQPAVEDAVDQSSGAAIDLLEGIKLRDGIAGEEESEHPSEAGAGHTAEDPHVWLDPKTWTHSVDRIEQALAEANPGHADEIGNRADTYRSSLADLDEDYSKGLERCSSRTIVTSHAAFGYLADRYDLQQIAITGISPEAEPSPKRLAEITDVVQREHITTIFTETLVSPRVAETLAREAGVKSAVLDPIEGLTKDEIDDGLDYADVMRENLSILRQALGCH